MANVVTEARPALWTIDARAVLVAALVLAVFAVVPWRHHGPERVVASLDLVKRPPVIVPMELYPAPEPPSLFEALADILRGPQAGWWLIAPPPHPDAQAWPRGMVIRPADFPHRMATDIPPTPGGLDGSAIDLPGALGRVVDKALSALLGRGMMTES